MGGAPAQAVIAYDDIASINYFGDLCKAWYRRDGRQITDAILYAQKHFDEILLRCAAMDETVSNDAQKAGGQDYEDIVNAAWRHTFAAHKLIATPKGEMAFLSKENDSNGCIGTVDVSYPSTRCSCTTAPSSSMPSAARCWNLPQCRFGTAILPRMMSAVTRWPPVRFTLPANHWPHGQPPAVLPVPCRYGCVGFALPDAGGRVR